MISRISGSPERPPTLPQALFFSQKNDPHIFGTCHQENWQYFVFFQEFGQKYHDFLKTKKMRTVRTINLAVVSRRDLQYVSENESFCFGQK